MAKNYWGTYFDRLCRVIDTPQSPDPLQYRNVLWHMHQTEFVPILRFDRNRIQDALDFRAWYLDDRATPVGIFELMVSLADRIETEIMGGTADHNRTAEWFWAMFESLGLIDMTDDAYNEREVDGILHRFVMRQYARNGRGGLFIISDKSVDLRKEEIWYQAALYLNNVLRSEGVLE